MTGNIFDIQKFALHDGPGIRTVVFLKGCPLKCVWCCNPESQVFEPQLGFLKEKCTNCIACIQACPNEVFSEENGQLKINFSACTACGNCLDECFHGALKIYGETRSVENIMAEVEKDRSYFENSGGGITLSGGDPLDQPEFSLALLKAAKKRGFHTCVETSGYASLEVINKIRPWVDLFLYDYKITDDFYHNRYTRVSNKEIIRNLEYLLNNGSQVILRCILIPGINDNEDHFQAIVDLENKFPELQGIEIMPYHNYGKGKYATLGKNPYDLGVDTVEDDQVIRWLETFQKMGAQKVKRG